MSILDIVIYTIDFIFQNTILKILPSSVPGLSINDLQAALAGVETTMTSVLSGFGFIAPVGLLLALVLVVMSAEVSLFLFHVAMTIVKLIRG